MRLPLLPLIPLALLPLLISAADEPKHAKPCTVTSPSSGSYFDLSSLAVLPPAEDGKKSKDDWDESWMARGHDYGVNFTMNFCAPVVEELKDVVGVDKDEWRNVSAFYKQGEKTYSLGRSSDEPVFRGRKLVLNFTHGSPCEEDDVPKKRKIIDDDDDDDKKHSKGGSHVRRKSAIISFLCERDNYDSAKPKVAVSFVGASPDMCAYFFEARSPVSCGGASRNEEDAVGPGGVFGIMYDPLSTRTTTMDLLLSLACANLLAPVIQRSHRALRLHPWRYRLPAHRHAPAWLAADPKLRGLGGRRVFLQGESPPCPPPLPPLLAPVAAMYTAGLGGSQTQA